VRDAVGVPPGGDERGRGCLLPIAPETLS